MLQRILFFVLSFFSIMSVQAQTPNYHSDALEEVISLGKYQAIGLSVSAKNRLFVAFPRRGAPYEYGLTEIINGEKEPYPDKAWNAATSGEKYFASVQDLYVDGTDHLWVLDSKPAPASSVFGDKGAAKEGIFKLLQIELSSNKVLQTYHFEDLDKTKTALNDVRVDTDKQLAYLSNPGLAAIVVLDLKTGHSRVRLANSVFTQASPDIVLSYEGREMKNKEGQPFRSNVNSIALSRDNEYLYFKPINHYKLYRIATRYLADRTLSEAELLSHVEDLGNTVITHGMEADKNGNIYLTSSIDYSIKYLDHKGILHTLVQDKRILWPDSLGIGEDGYLYFSCAQLHKEAVWNNEKNLTEYPYKVYRVKLAP